MAKVWAEGAFNFDKYDFLGWLADREIAGDPGGEEERGQTTIGGATYSSSLNWSFDHRTSIVAGTNLRFDDPVGGREIVTGMIQGIAGSFTADGSNDDTGINGISISLSEMFERLEVGGRSGLRDILQDELSGNDTFNLSAQGDLARGFAGNDLMRGNGGNDRLFGGAGDDRLNGGAGADELQAGGGSDTLIGGAGRDRLQGGTDSLKDVFVFNARQDSTVGLNHDTIHNFSTGLDDIDLRGIDANARSASTDQAFAWSGHVAKANAVWWKADDKGVLLQADVNGDAKADFEIRLWNTDSIAVGDLLL